MEMLAVAWPDFHITSNDLNNPTSHVAVQFYERFICGQLLIKTNDLKKIFIERLSNHESYNDILDFYILFITTKWTIERLGLQDLITTFGITDLLNPTKLKFFTNFSLLTNVVVFATNALCDIDEIYNKILINVNEVADLQNKNDNALKEIKSFMLNRAICLENIVIWEQERKSVIDSLKTAKEDLEKMKEKVKNLKSEKFSLQEERRNLEEELDQLTNIEKELEDQIVDDHLIIINERERLEKEFKEEEVNLAKSEEILVLKMNDISFFKKSQESVKNFLDTMRLNNMFEKYELLNDAMLTTEELRNKLKKALFDVVKSAKIKHNLKDELSIKEKRMEEFHLQAEDRSKSLDEELHKLNEECEKEMDLNKKTWLHSKNIENEIKNFSNYNEELKATAMELSQYFEQMYETILGNRSELDNAFNRLQDKFEYLETQ